MACTVMVYIVMACVVVSADRPSLLVTNNPFFWSWQDKIERMVEVERAFVHVDYQVRYPHH